MNPKKNLILYYCLSIQIFKQAYIHRSMAANSIRYKKLQNTDFQQLYYTYMEAFEDYPINMQIPLADFKRRIYDRLAIDYGISVGAFHGEKLVGFILHTQNHFRGKKYAYNGGTGVIPSYRGMGLVAEMYEEIIPKIAANNITQLILEVLEGNTKAINSYEKVGFQKTRKMKSYLLSQMSFTPNPDFELLVASKPDFSSFTEEPDLVVDFMSTFGQLQRNQRNESMISAYAKDQRKSLGYIVFQPKNGRISRFYVNEKYRRIGVGRSLIHGVWYYSQKKQLSVINIDEQNLPAHRFLLACGFENQFDQFEMTLTIPKKAS